MALEAHDPSIVALAQDGRKNLYSVTASACLAVYKHYHLCQERLECIQPWSILQATPQPHFDVKDLAISFMGSFAVLIGDCDIKPNLGLLALSPQASDLESAHASTSSCGSVAQGRFTAWEAPKVGFGTPGVRKVKWMRGSDTHVCALTSNNHLLVYHVAPDQRKPSHQDFALGVSSGQPFCGLSGTERWVVDFDFGPMTLWGCFSVFFLCSDGAIFLLCPFLPEGVWVPQLIQQQMNQSLQSHDIPGAREFIIRMGALPGDEDIREKSPPNGLPANYIGIDLDMASSELLHDDDVRQDFCPTLQGPLNAKCGPIADQYDDKWEACSLSCSMDESGLGLIAIVTSAGKSFFHVILEDILPQWSSVRARKSMCPCKLSESNLDMHLFASCLLFNEEGLMLQIQGVPCFQGHFVCWGSTSRPLRIQVPCIKELAADIEVEKEAKVTAVFDDHQFDDVHNVLGVFFTSGAVCLGCKVNGVDIKMLPLDSSEKLLGSVSMERDGDLPATPRSQNYSSEISHLVPSSISPLSHQKATLRHDTRIDWGGIRELAVFLQAQLDTVETSERKIVNFEHYLETRIRTGHDLVDGHNDKLGIWEELWTVLDTWPSKGSCQLISNMEDLDLQSVKLLVSGIAGTCAQSKEPIRNRSPANSNYQILDSSTVERATKENGLMILGVRELLSTMVSK